MKQKNFLAVNFGSTHPTFPRILNSLLTMSIDNMRGSREKVCGEPKFNH